MKKTVFCSMPGFGGWVHQKLIQSLKSSSKNHRLDWRFIENASLISAARSSHLSVFYHENADYFISIDSDMVISPPGIIDRFIDHYESGRIPKDSIVGGFYAKKAVDPNGNHPPNGVPLSGKLSDIVIDGRLIECKHLPTGFLMISREGVNKMVKSFPELEYEEDYIQMKFGKDKMAYALYQTIVGEVDGKKSFVSEDYSFCMRATQCGIKIFGDTAAVLGHIGNTIYHLGHLIPGGK